MCVGGGSTTGLAKAVALTTGLPIVAVPTTYAGSEATDVWGLTEDGRKTTGVDPRVLPRAVVYDASLMLGLPVATSVASGLNALAHCVDAMWGPRVDPIDQSLAVEGIRALSTGLRQVVAAPRRAGGPGADPVRRLPRRGRLRLGRLRAAPQDLPRAGRHVRPAARRDARRRPALRPGAQRAGGPGAGPADGRGLRRRLGPGGAPRRCATSWGRRARCASSGWPRTISCGAVAPVLEAAPPDNPTPLTAQNVESLLRAAWDGKEPA